MGRSLACAWLLWLAVPAAVAQSVEPQGETQLKAAFVYNFTKYVTWPPAVEQTMGELVICALGSGPVSAHLKTVGGRKVRDFNLRVVQLQSPSQADRCHLLYLSGVDPAPALRRVAEQAVLTVSDTPDFIRRGGIIGLVEEQGRIRFEVNLGAARASQLQISSRLLQLAREVVGH